MENEKAFPENTAEIIESIVEKHGFKTIVEMFENEKSQEKWEAFPGPRIAKILKEFNQGKIKNEDNFIDALMKNLNISKENAQELFRDLQEKIINLGQETLEEKEEPKEKSTDSKKPDLYREEI